MSPKALRAIVGALVGLLVLYGAIRLVGMRGEPVSDAAVAMTEALASLDPAQVTAIHVVGAADSVKLERAGGTWTANGFPADTLPVTRLLNALGENPRATLVASNPANHERLGVGGPDAWRLIIEGATGAEGIGSLELVIGTTSTGGSDTYVRLRDSDDVFLVGAALRGAAARDLGQWRDRTIARVDTAAVSRVIVERDGVATEVVRGDSTWTAAGAPAAALPVRDLLGGLTSLIGIGFAPDSVRLDPVARTVAAIDAAGDTLAFVEIGEEHRPATVPARTPRVEGLLELTDFQADRIAPTRETLQGLPPPTEPGDLPE